MVSNLAHAAVCRVSGIGARTMISTPSLTW